ncbi:MAG: 3-phosphoshikimate 1-carboxyvinyltransferase [Candidatus Obscuribacterales bacterium]|nr:3-phosphoshikimate 1-carboxyvinyltransferase [Candidatus Obscuribacterales bacterium]
MTSGSLAGILKVPGDKSVTHRALIFSSFAYGRVEINNASSAADCNNTAQCLSRLGLSIDGKDGGYVVNCCGIESLVESDEILDCGNSGTTMRLLAGILAGRPIRSTLDGDRSLRSRTMKRIIEPLSQMGARFETSNGDFAPFSLTGGSLSGTKFDLQIASAQVETCVLLAGLQADGVTQVRVPQVVRDHTRRMFAHIGVPFESPDKHNISVRRLEKPLAPFAIEVPADLSSAAFFLVAASLIEGSDIVLTAVGVNPGRTLVLSVLEEMGVSLERSNQRFFAAEPVVDLRVRHMGRLQGTRVGADRVSAGIDELPILALCGSLCQGQFEVSGALELRHKESDRIKALCDNLKAAGVEVVEHDDGFSINGAKSVPGGSLWRTHGDHRLAMTGRIASLVFDQPVELDYPDCIEVSYPEFSRDLSKLLSF